MGISAAGLDRADVESMLENRGWVEHEVSTAITQAMGGNDYIDARVRVVFDHDSATFLLFIKD